MKIKINTKNLKNEYCYNWISMYYESHKIKLEDILNYNIAEELKEDIEYDVIFYDEKFYFVEDKKIDENGFLDYCVTYLVKPNNIKVIEDDDDNINKDINIGDKVYVASNEYQYLYYDHFFDFNKVEDDRLKLHWVYGKNIEADENEYYIVRYIGKHSEFLTPIYLIENRDEEIYMIGEGIKRVE